MCHNYQNMHSFLLKLIFVSALAFAGIGCDNFLPADFKAKNYDPAEMDLRAAGLLTRDTINNAQGVTVYHQYAPSLLDSTGTTPIEYRVLPISWSVINSRTLASFASLPSGTDNQIISSNFDVLADSLPSLSTDTLILVSYPASEKVTYAVLKSAAAKDIYIYTSLQYYYANGVSNVNDYVSVDLVKKDTSLVSSSLALLPESVYGSTETILYVSNTTKNVSAISARYTVHLDQGGVYLVRFTLSNPQQISNPQAKPASSFGLPAIANQFKVVVLSF